MLKSAKSVSEKSAIRTATLLMRSPDQKGLVREISDFIFRHNGNIVSLQQHIDHETDQFFSRFEWALEGFTIPDGRIGAEFQPLAERFGLDFQVRFSDARPRVAIFVSKLEHCLVDLLHRWSIGELRCEIAAIVSNHRDLASIAKQHGIPYHVFEITPDTKPRQEQRQLELLAALKVELVILARYMQVLTGQFISHYPNRIINIHHSFLPAFTGANPYARAYARGVKIIGATSHYVTEDLDEGPIIEQDVTRVSHRDTIPDMVRKGRDLERMVLARGVRLDLESRVLAYANKTVVFE